LAETVIALNSLRVTRADLGLRPFGMRAMMSLRLHRSFGSWMREFKPDYTPLETGLARRSCTARRCSIQTMNTSEDKQ